MACVWWLDGVTFLNTTKVTDIICCGDPRSPKKTLISLKQYLAGRPPRQGSAVRPCKMFFLSDYGENCDDKQSCCLCRPAPSATPQAARGCCAPSTATPSATPGFTSYAPMALSRGVCVLLPSCLSVILDDSEENLIDLKLRSCSGYVVTITYTKSQGYGFFASCSAHGPGDQVIPSLACERYDCC